MGRDHEVQTETSPKITLAAVDWLLMRYASVTTSKLKLKIPNSSKMVLYIKNQFKILCKTILLSFLSRNSINFHSHNKKLNHSHINASIRI